LYNPNQPRIPKHHSGGGRWTRDGYGFLSDLAELRAPDNDEEGVRQASARVQEYPLWPLPTSRDFAAGWQIDPNWISDFDTDDPSRLVQLAAMLWPDKRDRVFGQLELPLESGGGGWGYRGGSLSLSLPFRRWLQRSPTAGVLRTPKGDFELVSGTGGPALRMLGKPGFNRWTLTHVEGHAAAEMWQNKIGEATLYINNTAICGQCIANLPRMLPPGAKLHVVLPNGASRTFSGRAP
jgi:hypothetical protein